MIKYLIRRLWLLLLAFVVSCTAVDNFFGNDIIPPSQEMESGIDSMMKVRTSIFKVDSTVSNLAGIGFIGSIIDPLVGRTDVGFFHTYLPLAFPTDSMFGYKPTLDSMFAILHFANHYGDTLQPMNVSIYEIADSTLKYSIPYYLNANAEAYYNSNQAPLAKFELRGEVSKKVALPKSFYDKFLLTHPKNADQKKSHPYLVDSLWVKMFKGLYFKADPITSGNGQVARVNLSTSSVLRLHYHNKNKSADTTLQEFIFYNSNKLYSIGFAVSNHDYSYSRPELGGVNPSVINDTTIESSRIYVQGLDGLGGRVTLDTLHLRKMRNDAAAKGFSTIAVHRAAIKWYLPTQTAENYNLSFGGIGMYYSMTGLDFIADYNPNFIDNSSGTSVDNNPLGGKINRSTGYYEQNITSLVQRLLTDKTQQCTVELLPLWGEMFLPNRTVIGGSKVGSGYEPEIIITYTLLR